MQWTPAKKICHEKLLVCSQHSKSLDIKGFPLQKKKKSHEKHFHFLFNEWKQGMLSQRYALSRSHEMHA